MQDKKTRHKVKKD
jgi:WD40 repeat protein